MTSSPNRKGSGGDKSPPGPTKNIKKDKPVKEKPEKTTQSILKKFLRHFRSYMFMDPWLDWQDKKQYHIVAKTLVKRCFKFYTSEVPLPDDKDKDLSYAGFGVPRELFIAHSSVFIKFICTKLKVYHGVLKIVRPPKEEANSDLEDSASQDKNDLVFEGLSFDEDFMINMDKVFGNKPNKKTVQKLFENEAIQHLFEVYSTYPIEEGVMSSKVTGLSKFKSIYGQKDIDELKKYLKKVKGFAATLLQ